MALPGGAQTSGEGDGAAPPPAFESRLQRYSRLLKRGPPFLRHVPKKEFERGALEERDLDAHARARTAGTDEEREGVEALSRAAAAAFREGRPPPAQELPIYAMTIRIADTTNQAVFGPGAHERRGGANVWAPDRNLDTRCAAVVMGVTAEGSHVALRVSYRPTLVFEIQREWSGVDLECLRLLCVAKGGCQRPDGTFGDPSLVRTSVEERTRGREADIGENGRLKVRRYLRVSFPSLAARDQAKRFFRRVDPSGRGGTCSVYRWVERAAVAAASNGDPPGGGQRVLKIKLEETLVKPEIEAMDLSGVKPFHWISVRGAVLVPRDRQITRADYELVTHRSRLLRDAVRVVEEGDLVASAPPPILLMSYDIEASSDIGSFPDPEVPEDRVYMIGACLSYYQAIPRRLQERLPALKPGQTFSRVLFTTLESCEDVAGAVVVRCRDEADMLRRFGAFVGSGARPDVVTGWNTWKFDNLFLGTRDRVLGAGAFGGVGWFVHERRKMIMKHVESSAMKSNDLYLLFCSPYGGDADARFEIDGCFWTRDNHTHDSYKLDSIAEAYLGRGQGKHDVGVVEMILVSRGEVPPAPEDVTKVGAYCLKDADLVVQLNGNLGMLSRTVSMAAATGCLPNVIPVSGKEALIVPLIVLAARRLGFILNNMGDDRYRRQGRKYAGGLVLDQVAELFESPVGLLDFKALYPSVSQEYNLGSSTLFLPWEEGVEDRVRRLRKRGVPIISLDAEGDTYYVVVHQHPGQPLPKFWPEGADPALGYESLFAAVVRTLAEKRSAAKGELKRAKARLKEAKARLAAALEGGAEGERKDAEVEVTRAEIDIIRFDSDQLAFKKVSNSCYGAMAGPGGVIANFFLAKLITSCGRNATSTCVRYVHEHHPELGPVYGDTDSIMVRMPRGTTATAALPFLRGLAEKLTALFYHPMEMELEYILISLLLIGRRKYYAYKALPPTEEAAAQFDAGSYVFPPEALVMKGLKAKRRDTAPVAKRTFLAAAEKIMDHAIADVSERLVESLVVLHGNLTAIVEDRLPIEDYAIGCSRNAGYKNVLPSGKLALPPSGVLAAWAEERYCPGSGTLPGERTSFVITGRDYERLRCPEHYRSNMVETVREGPRTVRKMIEYASPEEGRRRDAGKRNEEQKSFSACIETPLAVADPSTRHRLNRVYYIQKQIKTTVQLMLHPLKDAALRCLADACSDIAKFERARRGGAPVALTRRVADALDEFKAEAAKDEGVARGEPSRTGASGNRIPSTLYLQAHGYFRTPPPFDVLPAAARQLARAKFRGREAEDASGGRPRKRLRIAAPITSLRGGR